MAHLSRKSKYITVSVFFLLFFALFLLNNNNTKNIIVQEAKIVTGVDNEMQPLKITSYFPKNTTKVSTWIKWQDARINTQILVKWHYITDDVPIYDYNLTVPKRNGVANVMLSMPEGKNLPSGFYKVDILSGKKQLTKTLTFEVG